MAHNSLVLICIRELRIQTLAVAQANKLLLSLRRIDDSYNEVDPDCCSLPGIGLGHMFRSTGGFIT